MNHEDIYSKLKTEIDDIYSALARRPGMLAGRVICVEAFIRAIEYILDIIDDESDRPQKYVDFCIKKTSACSRLLGCSRQTTVAVHKLRRMLKIRHLSNTTEAVSLCYTLTILNNFVLISLDR